MGCSFTAIVYPSKEYVNAKNMVKATERNTMTLKQRQDLLMKNQVKLVNVSQKKYEIEQKMENIIDEPREMRQLQTVVRDIKTARRNQLSGVIERNKYMARNWQVFEKIKHQRLASSNKTNWTAVIRKKKRIERLTRKKHIDYQQFWEKRKEEVSCHGW